VSAVSPPQFDSDEAYADRLSDVAFWEPLVAEALRRAGRPAATIRATPQRGTYPTFSVGGQLVVKLFGERYCGPESYRAESAAYAELSPTRLPIPAVVYEGEILASNEGWPWPFLVLTRIEGIPYALAAPAFSNLQRHRAAQDAGKFLGQLHAVPVREPQRWDDFGAFLAGRRAAAQSDHARWASLPEGLVAEMDAWLPTTEELFDPRTAPPVLLHGDLHKDHLFVDAAIGAIKGVIDFSDAQLGDRRYDLVALHAGTFHFDRRLLRACLLGYGWAPSRSFAKEMLAFTLLHDFNMFDELGALAPRVAAVRTLDELADLLWSLGDDA